MLSEREKFNFLWRNSTTAYCQLFDAIAHDIYQWGQTTFGSKGFSATDPGAALQARLAPTQQARRRLSPNMVAAICFRFGITPEIWKQDEREYCEKAAAALRAAGTLAHDPPIPIHSVGAQRWDLWPLSEKGQPVKLAIAPLGGQPAVMEQVLFGIQGQGPVIPTFRGGELVQLLINSQIEARLRLFHLSPERRAVLVAPSVFMPDEQLAAGQSLLPVAAPPGHEKAFEIHEPIGIHYLVAVAVAIDRKVRVTLPVPDRDPMNLRAVTEAELDLLAQQLGGLRNPEAFGVGVLRYQVIHGD